jgi:hypothetical protein
MYPYNFKNIEKSLLSLLRYVYENENSDFYKKKFSDFTREFEKLGGDGNIDLEEHQKNFLSL